MSPRLEPAAPAGLPRLLAGLDGSGTAMSWAEHQARHGPMPHRPAAETIELVKHSGLRGRGGADFPAATKLEAVARRGGRKALVVNGSETEPASAKDRLLLEGLPHLVLDGAELAARTIGAGEILVVVGPAAPRALETMRAAVEARESRHAVSIVAGAPGYVAGEETAVLSLLAGRPAKPTVVPPRPFERGYRGRPTLIQNPETLAQLALIARHGPHWFRELGTDADPGSVLVTVSGAIGSPGVYELAFGTPLRQLLAAAGGPSEPLSALLVGGYFGTWVGADAAMRLRLSREELRTAGCSLGSGVVIALGQSSCGLHESARLVRYLASQSAGQCGPCVHGLAAISDSFSALSEGRAGMGEEQRIARWGGEVRGRGACHHPDGVARLVDTALSVFAREIEEHRMGTCRARPAGLPLGQDAVPA